MLTSLAVLALILSPAQDLKTSADFYPPAQFDVGLSVYNRDGDIEVTNNTHLNLSTKITTIEFEPQVLVPHVPADHQLFTDQDVVGPQASVLRGFWASTKEYPQPHGKNSVVEVITASAWFHNLAEEERALGRVLLERTVVDQILVPLLLAIIDMDSMKSRGAREALRRIAKEALVHNSKVLEDLKYEVYDKGSAKDAFWVITNFVWRELETGGLAKDVILDGIRVNLKARFAVWLAKRRLMSIHPALRAIDWIHKVLDKGPDVLQIMNTLKDLKITPGKLTFRAYFRTGVDDISPRFVRVGNVDHQFVVTGYHMFPVDGLEPRISFSDRRGRPIYTANPDWVLPNGSQLQVTVPNSELQRALWPLRATATFGIEAIQIPGEIRLVQEVEGFSLVPAKAMVGQPIRIVGPTLDPFYVNNAVYFGTAQKRERVRAQVERIAHGYIAITVPNLSPAVKPKDWRVWVEETGGGRERSSRMMNFELLPGTWREETADRREKSMAEEGDEFTGVLSRQNPVATHDFTADGGMQVVVTIPSAYGTLNDRGSIIDGFRLSLVEGQPDGTERVVPVTEAINDIRGPQPTATLRHTTDGRVALNTYRIELRYGSGEPIEYKLKYETKRVDDCASGEDASQYMTQAMLIHAGERYVGHLYGEQLKYREDLWDTYLVPNVQRGQKIKVRLNNVTGGAPFNDQNTAIRAMYLYFTSNGQSQVVASWTNPVGPLSGQVEIFHEDPVPGDYVLAFRHMSGNVEYWFQVDVGYDFGPSLDQAPIVSRFDSGVTEGWKVGPLADAPKDPVLRGENTAGYVSSGLGDDGRKGPLDLVLVIDNTQSMSGVIGAVKDQARQIVESLSRNSTDMRVGLVSFSDIAADGANARKLYSLSDRVQAQLDTLQAWSLGSGGNDAPEDMLHGLRGAIDMDWRSTGAQGFQVGKAIVVISDNPAKLTDGKDAQGNSLDSIAQAARAKGIQIFPVMMRSDPTFLSHSNTLASRTGGQVVDWSAQSQVVETLTSVAAQAVERSMPRYWIAPTKFHGDMSRFYGRSLAFELASDTTPNGFDADDVILSGGGLVFTLRSSTRPEGNSMYKTGWSRTVVPLSAIAYWTNRATGQRPTADDWTKLLASVDGLKIRGEFYAGRDACSLDNVEFGTSRHPNDRGLTEQGKRDAAMVREAIEAMDRRWSLYTHVTDIIELDRWLLGWAQAQGLPEGAILGVLHYDLLGAVKEPRLFSVLHYLRDEPQRQLRAWLERIRLSGQLSNDERTRYGSGIREWNDRMAKFDQVRRNMEFNIQRYALAAHRYYQGAPPEREMNRGLMASHEQAVKGLVTEMRALAYKTGPEPP